MPKRMRRALIGVIIFASAPAAAADWSSAVELRLERRVAGPASVRFGLPLLPKAQVDARNVRVVAGGKVLPARVAELLADYNAAGARIGPRALLIQLPAAAMPGPSLAITVKLRATDAAAAAPPELVYRSDEVSTDSAEMVRTAVRTVVSRGGKAALVEQPAVVRTLFVGREPRVLVHYPEGYLAATRILGGQVTAAQAARPPLGGLAFFSRELRAFTGAALYDEPYAINPDPDSVPDPKGNYEGWLYDRCATYLIAYTHLGEPRFLRAALRSCSYYASQIRTQGPERGIFAGKPDPDPKYSHLRGLYAYYALTGDEAALAAGRAIADLWYDDERFVGPYRQGHVRGREKQWTERLLGTSLEGLLYGARLTGDRKYLAAFRELFETAYRHVTGDRNALAAINSGLAFPPQNCFVHSAQQHGEGDDNQPWCSGWMTELLVDPLLRWQEQTGDARVDEIFVRLARQLRDVGTTYFRGDQLGDTFLAPSFCDDPNDGNDRRMLVPTYGSGIDASGKRRLSGESEDYQHCADATALTAAAIRALKRQHQYDAHPIGPFKSEGESFLQLHHELAYCARTAFEHQTRAGRDPSKWSAADLADGLKDPAGFVNKMKIGFTTHANSPQRRLSWWFNTSMEQFALLAEAGVEVQKLGNGRVKGPPCPH
jgi:hypothetical protein